ncbi:unnamed protein product [Allacma fusca]|uniref:CRAL-TRIO domain-containing protein n=1 Tax=Allacma fusca TaxID=39272 RepID=A0A8J2P829_9HEXA|nr:unnamed protein product [Allacma fusca]
MYYIIYLAISLWGISTANASNLTDAEILAYDSPPIIQENFPYYLSGYDDEGAPIWVFELGKWDIRKFLEKDNETAYAMDVACDQMFLRFRESAIKSQEKQFLCICDLDKFSLRQATHLRSIQFILSKFLRLEQIVQSGYLKQAWIVNANYLWDRVWQLGRPLLGALGSQIDVYGYNKEVWKPKLLKYLPRDQIPEWYGGVPNHKPVRVIG